VITWIKKHFKKLKLELI